jgi:YebC/PmpR family DNA-binding regulatory protein
MSGHSKWAQIKRQKGVADAKRGQQFSKLVRQIAIAAKDGTDPTSNFKLRLLIDKAKEIGMPTDVVSRAIDRGSGKSKEALLESVTYEGYGPGGSAFIVEAATDNRNRTSQKIRSVFTKFGGRLAEMGSVAWQFEPKGQILVEKTGNLEEIMLKAIDFGAEDVKESEEGLEVYTAPIDLGRIKQALSEQDVSVVASEIIMKPQNPVLLNAQETSQVQKLTETLEDDEDVVAVHSNVNL